MKIKTKMLAVVAVAFAAWSCQKPGEDLSFGRESLNDLTVNAFTTVTCPATPIAQSITSPLTLTTGNAYLLESGNTVVDGTTLTIQPGVVIFAEADAALIIKTNATISAAGTSTSPIIFTSDQNPGSRTPGYWHGIFVLGEAPNNQNNSLTLNINSTNFTAGGSVSADNSGTLEYVQIHYAGKGGGPSATGRETGGLTLASLGSGTTINHIQVTESNLEGFGIWGGTVTLERIIAHKVRRTDFRFSYGYTGNGQYLAGVKKDVTANSSAVNGYAMDISDVLFSSESALSNVHTYPTISNASFLGWEFCSSESNADAIYFLNDGNGRIYNSVISSFSRYALFLDGNNVMANTAGSPELQFSYNSFHQIANNPQYSHFPVIWAGCSFSMADWIDGIPGCEEEGNQFTVTTLGLGSGDVCVTCPTQPDFALGTNTLSAPNFTWDSGNVFEHPNYRGAFGTTPWVTTGWSEWCPNSIDYCD